jgi:hypothetical protein
MRDNVFDEFETDDTSVTGMKVAILDVQLQKSVHCCIRYKGLYNLI